MIKYNQKIGISENVTLVEFGKGDICVHQEYDHTDKSIIVALSNLKTELPIGQEIPERKGKSVNELQQDVILYFPTLESLDNVLGGLLKMRTKIVINSLNLEVKVFDKKEENKNESV